MDEQIKELSLLLLYLTSWEEEGIQEDVQRSWKGYPFDILNTLKDENIIYGSKQAKSVYLTETGIEKAKKIAMKYHIKA